MNETMVTVVGNVVSDPTLRVTSGGAKVASFRLASTERRFDRGVGGWRDGDTIFWQVSCWRRAAENVADSLVKGQPVVVHGRLRERGYEVEGQRRTSLEIEASTVGHDLSRGVARFRKAAPPAPGGAGGPADATVTALPTDAAPAGPAGAPPVDDVPAPVEDVPA
jgi:single-strand DNA-binding protein